MCVTLPSNYVCYLVLKPCVLSCPQTMCVNLSRRACQLVSPCVSTCLTMRVNFSHLACQLLSPCVSICLTMRVNFSHLACQLISPCVSTCLTMRVNLSHHVRTCQLLSSCVSTCLTMSYLGFSPCPLPRPTFFFTRSRPPQGGGAEVRGAVHADLCDAQEREKG